MIPIGPGFLNQVPTLPNSASEVWCATGLESRPRPIGMEGRRDCDG